ncbi:MAG: sigma 54-interacting transcriptional regulator, partial [Vicinamibacteria bacterium]
MTGLAESRYPADSLETRSSRGGGFGGFIGTSPEMERLYHMLAIAGPSTASVLLAGESGTGKELAARTLHKLSQRRRGPFIA